MHLYTKHGYISTEPFCTLQDIYRRKCDITEDEIQEALDRPSNFGWHGRDEMFETWSLGPVILTRDSDILTQSNAAALEKAIENSCHFQCDRSGAVILGLFDEDDIEINGANHWAVGWVDHLSFRAVEENGEPTNAFAFVMLWSDMLAEYPIADEADFSEREWEWAVEYVSDGYWTRQELKDDLPDNWVSQILVELCELPTENYGNDSDIEAAAEKLGFLEDEDE